MISLFAETLPQIGILNVPLWHWGILISWFLILIILDVAVIHRNDHEESLRSASLQSFAWISLGVIMGFLFWAVYGSEASGQYFSGFLIEKSLSIDNVFAWSIILTYFKIPKKYQHRVLFWGVIGALIMRAIFIFAGIAVIDRFEPVLLIFGAILLWSGFKIMLHDHGTEFDPAQSRFVKIAKRLFPVSHNLDGHKLFTIEKGKKVATLLFLALLTIEFTDVLFAIDSVPAILAISRDPFIVFASNASAILGLRALYFVFDKIKDRFWLLNKALGVLLVGVGIKMVISPSEIFGQNWFGIHVPTHISLISIGSVVLITIVASILLPTPETK